MTTNMPDTDLYLPIFDPNDDEDAGWEDIDPDYGDDDDE